MLLNSYIPTIDFKTEYGTEIQRDNVFESVDLNRLSDDTFLVACILAGCDYLDSLSSIGIKKAVTIAGKAEALLRSGNPAFTDITSEVFLERLIMLIKLSGVDEAAIRAEFPGQVLQAILTFRHQTVFCPIQRRLVPLNQSDKSYAFCGDLYDADTACKVADCEIHPETKEAFSIPSPLFEEKKAKKARVASSVNNQNLPPPNIAKEKKTLLDCWNYTVPFSGKACAVFTDPVVVVDLCDSDSPVRNETRPSLINLDCFRSGSFKAEKPDVSPRAIEKYRFNS